MRECKDRYGTVQPQRCGHRTNPVHAAARGSECVPCETCKATESLFHAALPFPGRASSCRGDGFERSRHRTLVQIPVFIEAKTREVKACRAGQSR